MNCNTVIADITNEEVDEILEDVPKKEEDIPIRCTAPNIESVEVRKLDIIQQKDNKTFRLVYVCLSFVFVVYIFQTYVTTDKELTTSIIELLKAIIFSACGYIFAKNMG